MKKILFFIGMLLILVGCEEVTVDPTTRQVEVDLVVRSGDLMQFYLDSEDHGNLEDVSFEVVFKNLAENNLTEADFTIKWFENENEITANKNKKTYVVIVKTTMEKTIKVEASYNKGGKSETLRDSQNVSVSEKPTQIVINNVYNNHIQKLLYGGSNELTYQATLTGNLTHKEALWTVEYRDSKNEVTKEEFSINLTDEGFPKEGVGYLDLDYQFDKVGEYVIQLKAGKYESNFRFVVVGYGAFDLAIHEEDTLIQTANFSERRLFVGAAPEALGEGEYRWYLNGELLVDENEQQLTHNDNSNGGYLYYVEFVPNNEEFETIKTEPLLIVNGLVVNDLEEFNNALGDEEVGAIVLANDIDYGSGSRIEIKRPLTIYGNNKEFKTSGIDIIFNITSDNVYFSNITISESRKYSVHYYNVSNGYLENVSFVNPGKGGSMTSLSAALYVHSSEVTIKNTAISGASNTGIRIDSPGAAETKKSILTILGTFDHGGTFLPVASGNSKRENVEVWSEGFVDFSIPLQASLDGEDGEFAIIRWSNEEEAVSWTLNQPKNWKYLPNKYLDVEGITIDVRLGELLGGGSIPGDLEMVYIFLDMFKQYGTIEIFNLDNESLGRYYVVGYQTGENSVKYYNRPSSVEVTEDYYVFGFDKLLYSSDTEGETPVKIKVPAIAGEYRVRITVGDVLDLGYFTIEVTNE